VVLVVRSIILATIIIAIIVAAAIVIIRRRRRRLRIMMMMLRTMTTIIILVILLFFVCLLLMMMNVMMMTMVHDRHFVCVTRTSTTVVTGIIRFLHRRVGVVVIKFVAVLAAVVVFQDDVRVLVDQLFLLSTLGQQIRLLRCGRSTGTATDHTSTMILILR